jgi:hypothetical protein
MYKLQRLVVVSILRRGGNELSKGECVHPFALVPGNQKRLPFRREVLEARDAH